MKFAPLALALTIAVCPTFAPLQAQGVATDEQIILKQIMTDKKAVYAQNLKLTDSESRAFWPIYDEYESKVKVLDDEFIRLVNDFAAKYDALGESDAAAMLKTKMQIEKERMELKQTYTRKVAKVLPAVKALRYAQLETRIESLIRRDVYGLIPLAR